MVQNDGKVVLAGGTGAGNFGVARFMAEGDGLDGSFSGDGLSLVDMGSPSDRATALALQSDGKLVVAGEVQGAWGLDVAVMRLNADGSLDPGFSGDGRAYFDLNHFKDDRVTAVAMQGSKILVAGWVPEGAGTRFAVLRLNADGSPDALFGSGGVKLVSFAPEGFASARANALLVSNGKIILAGRAEVNANHWYFGVARLTSSGALDGSFSGNGLAAFSFADFGACAVGFKNEAFALAADPGFMLVAPGSSADRKLVVAGSSNACGSEDMAVARLHSNGALDLSFSGDGKRTVGAAGADAARAIRTSGGGCLPFPCATPKTITLAGYRDGGVGGADFRAARLRWDGALDGSFSGDGVLTTDFNGGLDRAYALALHGNKLYLAGEARVGALYEFGVARYKTQ